MDQKRAYINPLVPKADGKPLQLRPAKKVIQAIELDGMKKSEASLSVGSAATRRY